MIKAVTDCFFQTPGFHARAALTSIQAAFAIGVVSGKLDCDNFKFNPSHKNPRWRVVLE
jgi:hypothetical protein